METTQEAIIKRSIKVLERKIKSMESILSANPIGDLIQLRIHFQDMRRKHNDDWKSKEFREFVGAAAEKEKKLKALAEKQQNRSEMISELVKLREEVSNLKRELYYIEMRRQRA
jgi:hypothetical protein